MDSNKENSNGNSEIPESSQYIPESTLIPETNESGAIPESTSGRGDDGLPGGSAYGVQGETVKKSFLKKNLPFVILGGIALVIGGSFSYKVLSGNGVVNQVEAAQEQVQISAPVSKPEAKKNEAELIAEKPDLEKKEVQVNSQMPAIADAQGETPHQSAKVPDLQAGSKVKDFGQDLAVTSGNGIGANDVKQNVGGKNIGIEGSSENKGLPSSDSRNKDSEIEKLNEQIRLLKKEKAQCTPTGSKKNFDDKGKKIAQPVSNKYGKGSSESSKVGKHKTVAKTKKEKKLEKANDFNLRVAKNGLAWIKSDSGKIYNVRVNDSIPGLGIVKKIDEDKMIVIVGDKYVEQQ